MDWEDYINDRKIAKCDGFYMIIPKDQVDIIPLSCSVCDRLYRDRSDEQAHVDYGCCNQCALKWAHQNKERWRLGWRPTRDMVEESLKSRPPLTISINSEQ